MLVSEFEKRIKNIDSHLFLEKGYGFPNAFDVYYYKINEDKFVLSVGENGKLNTFNGELKFLNSKNKRKLLLASVDMSLTPLDKRIEHKWNVIIGNDDRGNRSIVAWEKSISHNGYVLNIDGPHDLSFYTAVFTDEEFSDLIKYIKTLPDGEYQAKIAEHGKWEVED